MRAQTSRIFVAGLMAALAVCHTAAAADQVAWAPDLPNAQQLASQRNQLVLLHFWSPDCAPCQRLEHTVFKDSEFGHVVSRDYVPVKINVKQSPSLAYQYGVNSWPMDVITTSDGRLIHKMVSPSETRQYSVVLSQISARRRVYGDTQAAASRPAEGGLAAYNQLAPDDSARSQPSYNQRGYDRERPTSQRADYDRQGPTNERAGYTAQRPSGNFAYDARQDETYGGLATRQPTTPRPSPPTGEVYNPYASRRASSPPTQRRDIDVRPEYGRVATPESWNRNQPPTASGPVTNDYASRQLEPSAAYGNGGQSLSAAPNRDQPSYRPSERQELGAYTAAPPAIGQTPSRPASSQRPPLATDNRLGPRPGPAVSQDSAGPIESVTAQSPRRPLDADGARSPSQTGPSWGLEGYCPVALVEQSKWAKGDPRWGVAHRGRTYLFSSVDAKQRFWAQPDRYAPALSGVDPVLFTGSGQHVDGKRNHGVVYRNQVYLFANEQTLQQFWRAPEDFAEQVRQATKASEDRQRRR